MKEQKKLKKLLDLKKIDIAVLKDSEKNQIYGGYLTQQCTGPDTNCTFPTCYKPIC